MVSNVQHHVSVPRPSNVSTHTNQQFQFDPWILWVTVRRCWPWAVPTGAVLAALVSFFILETFVPRYRAEHLLEANQDYLVFRGVLPTVTDLARTEKQLFYNPIVLDPVLSDANLRKAPSLADSEKADANLRRNLSIASAGDKTRIVVSYTDTDREAAALVCNAVVDSYLRQRDTFDNDRISNLEKWLEPEIDRWQQEVTIRQKQVQKLSEQTLGYSPGQRLAVIEDQNKFTLLSDLQGQITDLTVELALIEAAEKREQSGEGRAAEFVPPEFKIIRREPTKEQIQQLVNADKDVQEAESMINRYKAVVVSLEDQDLVRLRRDYYDEMQANVEEWTAKLNKAREVAEVDALQQLNERADRDFELAKEQADTQLALLRQQFAKNQSADRESAVLERANQLDDLRTRLSVLTKQYEEERSRLEKFGGASAELQFANDELLVANTVLTKLRDRIAAIRTERRQDGAVRSLAEAVPPKNPEETVPTKKLTMAAGAAFAIPFLLGLLWEFRVQRLTDSVAVEKSPFLAPIVGEVARLPSGTRSGSRSRRIFEESVDTLRANLFLSADTKDARSIAVVSSMSAEGKSSVASQLAISVAKATGQTVLLVDADLRCPDQHDIFGLDLGPGLSGVLSNEVGFDEAIDKSLGDLVHVMPAGPLNCSPHRLMNQSAMKHFVEEALDRYHVVIFDTAPVLAAGETLTIASAVDVSLLCVMRDVSRIEHVSRTTRRLAAAGAKIGGTVFSGVTQRQYADRYGDYHYATAAIESN